MELGASLYEDQYGVRSCSQNGKGEQKKMTPHTHTRCFIFNLADKLPPKLVRVLLGLNRFSASQNSKDWLLPGPVVPLQVKQK